jgi:hypothetical protein
MTRRVSLMIASVALPVLCACAASRHRVADTAERLETRAHVLAEDADNQPLGARYPASYGHDALALAYDAHQLGRAAEIGGTKDSSVQIAFDRVAREYYTLRDGVEHSDNLQARNDLKRVTDEYRAMRHELGYPDYAPEQH